MSGAMRIVTWNMGCNIPASGCREHHDKAWAYLLGELCPDIAFVQEATLTKIETARDFTSTICDLRPGLDAGTAVLVRSGLEAITANRGQRTSWCRRDCRRTRPLLRVAWAGRRGVLGVELQGATRRRHHDVPKYGCAGRLVTEAWRRKPRRSLSSERATRAEKRLRRDGG